MQHNVAGPGAEHRSTSGLVLIWAALAAVLVYGSKARAQETPRARTDAGVTTEMLDAMSRLPSDLGALPDMRVPADNPQTPAKVALGRRLFFEAYRSAFRDVFGTAPSLETVTKGIAAYERTLVTPDGDVQEARGTP